MASERKKRANIIASEGERERAVNVAEGEARARIIDAESRATAVKLAASAEATRLEIESIGAGKALKAIKEACGSGNADLAIKTQLMREYIQSQVALSTSNNSKVIITSGSADELFAKASAFIGTVSEK